jgi:hypothetical protein
MPHFYQPDLGAEPDNPFARDANNKLVRRGYCLDMNDRSLVMAMTQGIGAHLTNDEKRAHLTDLKRDHSSIRSVFKRFCRLRKGRHSTVSSDFSATGASNVMVAHQKAAQFRQESV